MTSAGWPNEEILALWRINASEQEHARAAIIKAVLSSSFSPEFGLGVFFIPSSDFPDDKLCLVQGIVETGNRVSVQCFCKQPDLRLIVHASLPHALQIGK